MKGGEMKSPPLQLTITILHIVEPGMGFACVKEKSKRRYDRASFVFHGGGAIRDSIKSCPS